MSVCFSLPSESFGSRLYEWFKRFLSELIVLGRHCLVGGYPAFQRLVHDRLVSKTNNVANSNLFLFGFCVLLSKIEDI